MGNNHYSNNYYYNYDINYIKGLTLDTIYPHAYHGDRYDNSTYYINRYISLINDIIKDKKIYLKFLSWIDNSSIDVNFKRNHIDCTLLMITAAYSYYKRIYNIFCKLLQSNRINVNIINNYGDSALIIAVKYLNTNMWFHYNTRKYGPKSSIHAIRKLLQHPNIDVNIRNNSGNTALIESFKNQKDLNFNRTVYNCNATYELIKHPNINVNLTNFQSQTPLMIAFKYSSYLNQDQDQDQNISNGGGIYQLITHKNIDLNIKDNYGKTALSYAINYKYDSNRFRINQIKYLIKQSSININIVDNSGFTEIQNICSKLHKDTKNTLYYKKIIKLFYENPNFKCSYIFSNFINIILNDKHHVYTEEYLKSIMNQSRKKCINSIIQYRKLYRSNIGIGM
jgi:hypothetical protein